MDNFYFITIQFFVLNVVHYSLESVCKEEKRHTERHVVLRDPWLISLLHMTKLEHFPVKSDHEDGQEE